jgi:hypothetical protein
MSAPCPMSDVRFGIKLVSDNGHHVHFRLFAATGGQHLGGCGQLVMTATEYARFRELLAPALTDRPDPATTANSVMGTCGEDGRCRSLHGPRHRRHGLRLDLPPPLGELILVSKRKDADMSSDWKAIQDAMDKDREKNPSLGSPAWARQQEAKRKQAQSGSGGGAR